MTIRSLLAIATVAVAALAVPCGASPEHPCLQEARAGKEGAEIDWRQGEADILADHVQLTYSDRFVKAGESYFSPDGSKVIFQAVEVPREGEAAEEFYAMFIASVVYDKATKRIQGLSDFKRLSPPGSANTCGWFHPSDPDVVIFASTIGPPSESDPPGFQRATGRYKWMFPPEMRIVTCNLSNADGSERSLKVMVEMEDAYTAEGSFSADGRHLVYCSLKTNEGDLFITDMNSGETALVVQARGYDGGPFFSPDGKRLCYRSDRRGDSLLQLFVADLAFNDAGSIIGLQREYQLTDNDAVNWCPFWHPSGRFLVYSTSDLGHQNYEIFMLDADPGNLPGSNGTIKYGTRARRITHASRADVLPAFNVDGSWMMWTSQRAEDGSSQLWAARFAMAPDRRLASGDRGEGDAAVQRQADRENRIVVEDPDSGRVFIYDMTTHTLSEYDIRTHTLKAVSDPADIELFERLHKAQQEQQP
jgi:Tol biopolymer transport system component